MIPFRTADGEITIREVAERSNALEAGIGLA